MLVEVANVAGGEPDSRVGVRNEAFGVQVASHQVGRKDLYSSIDAGCSSHFFIAHDSQIYSRQCLADVTGRAGSTLKMAALGTGGDKQGLREAIILDSNSSFTFKGSGANPTKA